MMWKNSPRYAVFALAACATVAALSGCQGKRQDAASTAAAAPQAVLVSVQEIKLQSVIMRTELPGRTSAYRVAEVRPQVSGIIQKRLFEEGAEVKEGQSLYQIDPAVYEANVASAKASLLQAQATLVSAQADAKRSAELVKVNAVSRSANDTAQANYKVALANVEAAKAALKAAQIDLRYTAVTSPITGKVSLSEVTPGALVTANQSQRLTVVQQLDPIYVDVTQSYDVLANLRQQAKEGVIKTGTEGSADVQLILEGDRVYDAIGKLTFQDTLVDESTGTVRIRAVFPNPDRELMPGMYVRARLVDGVREKAVKLDQRATMRRNTGEPYVYVVNRDNKVESRDIKIASAEGPYWILDSGLSEGDRVIIDGIQHVRPGSLVRCEPASAPGEKKPAAQPAAAAASAGASK